MIASVQLTDQELKFPSVLSFDRNTTKFSKEEQPVERMLN